MNKQTNMATYIQAMNLNNAVNKFRSLTLETDYFTLINYNTMILDNKIIKKYYKENPFNMHLYGDQ